MSFEKLTPDLILSAIENATGYRLTGLISPLPSYINRVYELRSVDGVKLIGKFYRPGRWTRDAILEEHRFVLMCRDAEIPVVAPLELENGSTLGCCDDGFFALYPKKAGRQLEITNDNDWKRLGSLIGRIHCVGAQESAKSRITLSPLLSLASDINHLCGDIIPARYRDRYRSVGVRMVDICVPLFDGLENIRIHGDCHRGNVLDRLEEGLMIIDFDDMVVGPPVQDLWLFLEDRAEKSNYEIELILEGYERFRMFDRSSIRCIEPLRAMRMVYFLAWCSRQIDDYQFRINFPSWGSDQFWEREINDLSEQLGIVMEVVDNREYN